MTNNAYFQPTPRIVSGESGVVTLGALAIISMEGGLGVGEGGDGDVGGDGDGECASLALFDNFYQISKYRRFS